MRITAQGEASFPEERFPCATEELQEQFDALIARGKERMDGSAVVICGLARDVRAALPHTTARIERLGTMFADYRVILFENDSKDDTLPYLRTWARENSHVRILAKRLCRRRWPSIISLGRARDLAMYRNRYLDELEKYANAEYVIVLDTDLPHGWSYEGIASTFGQDGWDMVGSYGVHFADLDNRRRFPCLFDGWAFRDVGQRYLNCDWRVLCRRPFYRGDPLLPVWSCFGGLAVYRTAALSVARYSGDDCDHVTLHHEMRRRGFHRLFMNPSQIVLYSRAPHVHRDPGPHELTPTTSNE